MSDIVRPKCPVVALEIEDHPDADALELAKVGGYRAVVRKGEFDNGDHAVYIPEGSIVPDYLLDRLGLTGRLAGKQKNRVKAIRLRGALSQGLLVPLIRVPGEEDVWVVERWFGGVEPAEVGDDKAEVLGIEKYVPPVPVSMAGAVWQAGQERTLGYDIENVKAWPGVFEEGEGVVMTEKVHGTFCGIGVLPGHMADPEHGNVVVFSKGLGQKGLAFDLSAEPPNVYVRAALDNGVPDKVYNTFRVELEARREPVYVLGEVFGAGVQDLAYGADSRKAGRLGFRVFDVHIGQRGTGQFVHDRLLGSLCDEMGLERVPVLYRGPYSDDVLAEHTDGRETVSGEEGHVREGVVVRPVVERRHPELGRVQLKSVSADYLLRKGGTEYN